MPLRKPNELEYKKIAFEIKDIHEDDEFFIFEGYASTFGNVDYGDDIVDRGAFIDSIDNPDIKTTILWQHNNCEPIGMPIEMREDDKGLFVRGKLPKDDTFVKGRVIPQMKVGSINSLSIGYTVVDFSLKDGKRHLEKLQLWEFSLVTFPMNNRASITGMKSATQFMDLPLADIDTVWDSSLATARVREFTESQDNPSRDYRNAFFWYDRENADKFESYKLPFADVIDGKMVAIPRGIFASAGAMQGARGGVDIPDSERLAVERHINRYYDKLELDSPFTKGGLGKNELSMMNVKEIEQYLKYSNLFSRKVCKAMATYLNTSQCEADSGTQCEAGYKSNPFLDELKDFNNAFAN